MESVGFRIRNHDDILDYGPHKGVVDHDEAVRDGGDLAQELGGGAAQVEGGGIKGRLEVGGKFGGGVGVWERTESAGFGIGGNVCWGQRVGPNRARGSLIG